uniref:Secreted protein n=1 Tax=Heterorhabditis bacteriophora TaxID=37862 RepID=A0A1I7XPP8_HETBA
MKLFVTLFQVLLLFRCSFASIRWKRQTGLVEEGLDIPITLRSLITCLTPGIRDHLCFGPRVEILKRERLGLSERRGFANGYHNGVDVRLFLLKCDDGHETVVHIRD